LTGAAIAHAATLTWDANTATAGAQDGSGTWDATANNWWTGSANTTWNSAAPDAAIFGANGGVAGTVTLGASVVSADIRFNAPSVGNYTVAGGGNTLALTNRVIYPTVNAAIAADIAGGMVTLSHGPQQAPSGVLTLSGNNSFTGGFVIGQNSNNPDNQAAPNTTCAVRATAGTVFGTGAISFNGQGNATSPRLELTGGFTLANTISFQGRNNVAVGIESFSGANTLSGNITPAAGGSQYPVRVDGASSLTLGGTITLQTGGPRAFVLGGTGTGTVSGNIAGGSATVATIVVNKAGTGAWTFSGANTYSSSYILSGGTLNLDYTTQNNAKLSSLTPLYLSGGTLNLNGGSFTETVSSNNLVAGASTIGRAAGTGTLRLNAINRRGGGTLDFGAVGIADTDTLNVNGILGGYATVAGADWAVNSTGAGDGAIAVCTGYTDIAATGSTIANGPGSNVRLNSAGSGGSIALESSTTTINTLLQNTTTPATIDTSAGTLRLGATGGVLVPSGRQSLSLGASANSGTLTAGGADNTAGEVILINNSANNLVVNSTITDNGAGVVALTKSGSGSATLNGNNTHSGTNYIVGGTLNISSAANLGYGAIVINGGTLLANASVDLGNLVFVGPSAGYGNGTISVASGQTLNLYGVVANNDPYLTGVSLAGSLTKTGPGTLVLSGANTHTLGTIINAGTVSISSDGNLGSFTSPSLNGTFTCYRPDNIVINGGTLEAAGTFELSANRGIRLGPVNGSGSGTISVTDGNTLTFNGQISDNWAGSASLTKSGNGTLILGGGVNDYSGNTTVSAGTLQLNNIRALPNGAGKGNLILNGTLALNNVGPSLNGVSGSGIVDNIGANPVTLTLGTLNTSDSVSAIHNTGGGPLTLAKTGTGTLTLGGASTYAGATLVNNGTLSLGSSASISGTTNITVSAGATLNVSALSGGLTLNYGATLGGSGSVTGSITDNNNIISPGASAGTLTVSGGLTLNGGSTLNFELSDTTTVGSGVNDLIVVGGVLNLAGPTTLNLTYLNGAPAVGTYTLIQYGSFSGSLANLTAPLGFTLTNNTAVNAIQLLVTHPPATLTWRGDGVLNSWDTGLTANWIQDGTNQYFFTADTAVFDDTGSNSPSISLSSGLFPSAVLVNASKDYTFSGGGIGSGSLTKNGGGVLTLENTNTYTGATVINSGILQVGSGFADGTLGIGPTTNNVLLAFNCMNPVAYTNLISGTGSISNYSSGDVTLSGPISGNSVIMSGFGALVLSGSNSYTGPTVITSGSVRPRNANALGTAASGTIATNGGQLYIDANVSFPDEALTLGGAALRKGGGGATTLGGPITVVSDTSIHIDGGATLNLTNAAGIPASGFNLTLSDDGGGSQGTIAGPITLGAGYLTKSGGGTWTIGPTNTYTGKTYINGGTLAVSAETALGYMPGVWTPDYVSFGGGLLGVTTNSGVLNFAFADSLRGLTFNGNGGFNVGPGATLTISNELAGFGNLTKWGSGTLVLAGPNSLSGILYLDRWADGNNNDGITRITTASAIQNITEIRMRNTSVNTAGGATFQLDGSAGNLNVTQPIWFSCRQDAATNATVQSLAGSNTLSGAITITAGGNYVNVQTDAGAKLAIAGNVQYNDTLLALRNIRFQGDGDTLVSGEIQLSANGVTPVAVIKTGAGTLTLAGANTYSDVTVVSNGVMLLTGSITSTGAVTVAGGTLAGTGTINNNLTVQPAGTLSPGLGSGSIGTLTVNGNVALSGTVNVDINKTAGTRDQVVGVGNITYGGTLAVNNLSGTLTTNDTFQLFSATTPSGDFTSVAGSAGSGLKFSFNPATGVLSVVPGYPSEPPVVAYSFGGNTLTLSWPSAYSGYVLQSQTNALNVGLSNNWADVPGSGSSTQAVITVNPNNPTVFYRLREP
jgi:autotransporter-associated beta strand protein